MTGTKPVKPRDGHGKFLPTLQAAERRAQIIQLRQDGVPVAEIAVRFGISEELTYREFSKGIQERPRQAASQYFETTLAQREEIGRAHV